MKTICVFLFNLLAFPILIAQPPDSINLIQISDEAVTTIKLDGFPDFFAADGDDVWVTNIDKVQKLTSKNNAPVLSVDIPYPCGAPIVGEEALWVTSCMDKSVYKINHLTGEILAQIPVNIADPYGEISLAFGSGSVWILTDSSGILTRIDPKVNMILANINVNKHSYCATYGYNSVWITTSSDPGFVQRIDPNTNTVINTIQVGPNPRFLAAGENGIWTLNQKDGTVSHIDPNSNKLVATINAEVIGPGGDIAVGDEKVWVRGMNNTLILTIDPVENKVLTKYLPVCGSGAVRITNNHIWISAHDINTVWVLDKREKSY
jgi:virginiamycin B lyase